MKKALISLLTLFLLTACAEVPENIREQKKPTSSAVAFVPRKDYAFTIDKKFTAPTVEKLGKATFEQAYVPKATLIAAADNYYGSSLRDYVREDVFAAPEGIMYGNDESALCGLGQNGYFYFSDPEGTAAGGDTELTMSPGDDSEEYIYAYDFEDTALTLNGSEVSLADLADDAQQRLNDASRLMGYSLKYKPFYARLGKYKAEAYRAELVFGLDNGDGSGVRTVFVLDDYDGGNSPWFSFSVEYSAPERPDSVRSSRGIILRTGLEETDEYISFEEAMDIVSEKLSDNVKLTLHFAQLEYLPRVTEFDPSAWKSTDSFNYQYGAKYTSDPYWAFYFEIKDNAQKVIYVNALTGELSMMFNNDR
ncbi:MAG: hypothetical protein IJ561_00155 [Ruminococcus sp.]|nr:hypothetical protein [Ruminococcus sp.]